ncbi:MAG: glycosyltransferase family 4 protein [Candidatus Goldbacteria bacterium]|nr:glycosyltransferase family 4 protein [Candidatus Goldiibacteriota bacterium]
MRKLKTRFGAAFTNVKPWDISLKKRIKILYEARENGMKTAVYLYESPDSSTFRYRAYNMCQALEFGKKWRGSYFFSYELEKLREYFDFINLAVAVRFRWTEELDLFIKECGEHSVRILFDLDDLVFDTGRIKFFLNTLGENLSDENTCNFWFAYFSRINSAASLCDALLSTNEFLASRLKRHYKKPSFVIRNFLNEEQISVSRELYEQKKARSYSHPFVIGYFSGSHSHSHDLDVAAPQIARLMEENKEIKFKIAGYIKMPEALKPFSKERVIMVPFKDFRELQKETSEVDLNIAPLIDNEFTNCKSELKYFEAAAAGTVTCASPVFSFKKAIVHGKNGYLCGSGGWYSVIKEIYKKGVDAKIVQNAKKHALLHYSPENQYENIEKVLENACAIKGSNKRRMK